jgi:hypothetical protein
MTTSDNMGWYYVGVLTLLLAGQQFLMNTAHKEAVAKLKTQQQEQLARAGIAPAPKTVSDASGVTASGANGAATSSVAPAKTAVLATPTPVPAPAAAPATTTSPDQSQTKMVAADASKTKGTSDSKGIFASAPKALPKVPVRLTFRSEPFEKGKIVTVANTSKQKLNCQVAVTRPTTGETKTFKVAIAPATEMRLAGAQGFSFKTGDKIQIAQAGYQPKSESVP